MKKKLLIIVLAFVVLLAGAYFLYNKLDKFVDTDRFAGEQGTQQSPGDPESPTNETTGSEKEKPKAPSVALTNWEGERVHLEEYFGKPIVLNFWASWCGPCKSEMPDFQKVYAELGNEVQFIMVNATGGRESVETAKEFITKAGYTFPVFFDVSEEAVFTYGAYSIPMTFFINAQGQLVTYATGALPEQYLRKGIDMITGKQ